MDNIVISKDKAPSAGVQYSDGVTLSELVGIIRSRLVLLTAGPLLVGLLVLGVNFLIPPTFTATVTCIPPQQSQSGAAAALASLGSLANLAGVGGAVRSQPDMYASLLQGSTVADRMVDRFKLMDLYSKTLRVDARRQLANRTRVIVGRKDGLITVEVDDHSPQQAADMANQYVEELRRITSTLAVTEAQKRRMFFEEQLKLSHERLLKSQQALQASGFNPGALKTEPRTTAESYARIRAEIAAGEVKLQTLRGTLTDGAVEVRQIQATVRELRQQLSRLEQVSPSQVGDDYVTRYRDFKYSEALFDVYARQFELARAEESREGAIIQVVDPASPPERKSRPTRGLNALSALLVSAVLLFVWVIARGILARHEQSKALRDVGA